MWHRAPVLRYADEILLSRRQQADLIVKPPKGHPQQYGMILDDYPEYIS